MVGRLSAGRTTEMFDSPLEAGDPEVKTSPGHSRARSSENLEKVLVDFIGSPTKSPPKEVVISLVFLVFLLLKNI